MSTKNAIKLIVFGSGDLEGWPTLMFHSMWIGGIIGCLFELFGNDITANIFLGMLSGFFIFMGLLLFLLIVNRIYRWRKQMITTKKKPIMVTDYTARCCGTCKNFWSDCSVCGISTDFVSPFGICADRYEAKK